MDEYRNTKMAINDVLLRKIVYSIEKGIGEDQQQYLRENHKETENATFDTLAKRFTVNEGSNLFLEGD